MALPPEPSGLVAELTHEGVVVEVGRFTLQISEWGLRIEERGLLSRHKWHVRLNELEGVTVGASSRSGRYSLLVRTRMESILIAPGADPEHLRWVVAAIREAEMTRARREGRDGREYLFQRVVPDEVQDLIDR